MAGRPEQHDRLGACGCRRDADGWRPNLTFVADDLAIGGSFEADRVLHLVEGTGIGAMIDLRSEAADDDAHLDAHGIVFLHLPTDDHCAPSPEALQAGVDFARAQAAAGRRLLVHCEHGIGRSATMALCIMVDRGEAPLSALSRAKDTRALVSPSPAQYGCWADWLRARPEAMAGVWSVPDFDAFKAIAYRHLSAG
jgi:hypothetical protein